MKIDPPLTAQPANPALIAYAESVFGRDGADRVFMYNPDAVGQWVFEKYGQSYLNEACFSGGLTLPMQTVMPSVTPVCFATMYTGTQPDVHGIRRYEKPVVRIDTLFDAMIRAGLRPAIVADSECSMGRIFLERKMDYYIFDSLNQVNACAAELIIKDEYDFIAVYNGNYDAYMHRYSPEGPEALAELRANSRTVDTFRHLIERNWTGHNTLLGFATDHGCHAIDGGCGSHGLDMPEDLNIRHTYLCIPARK